MGEFEYMTQEERESRTLNADFSQYSGGGYELRLRGHIDELKQRLQTLQQEDWIDNRTRALITEFSFYNAQVNLFGVVKIVAEFVGGGILPHYRVDILSLTREWNLKGYITFACEIFFILSTLYYIINSLGILKQMGVRDFFKEAWNIVDVFTIGLSVLTIGLWLLRSWKVLELTKKIGETRGNEFIPIENAQHINYFYEYTVSFTVFTSMLKLCRLLSFQKAFKQIAATIKLCFVGLSTFVVEFIIVFGSFCCFFYFVLSTKLRFEEVSSNPECKLFSCSETFTTFCTRWRTPSPCPLGSSISVV